MLAAEFPETASEKQQRVLEDMDRVLRDMDTLSKTMEHPLSVLPPMELVLDSPKEVIPHPTVGEVAISMDSAELSDTELAPVAGIFDYIKRLFW